MQHFLFSRQWKTKRENKAFLLGSMLGNGHVSCFATKKPLDLNMTGTRRSDCKISVLKGKRHTVKGFPLFLLRNINGHNGLSRMNPSRTTPFLSKWHVVTCANPFSQIKSSQKLVNILPVEGVCGKRP